MEQMVSDTCTAWFGHELSFWAESGLLVSLVMACAGVEGPAQFKNASLGLVALHRPRCACIVHFGGSLWPTLRRLSSNAVALAQLNRA